MKTLRSIDDARRDIDRLLERSINRILDTALNIAKQKTPVLTGRAKRGWTRRNKYRVGANRITVIENRVPYIGILDGAYPDRSGRRRGPIFKPALDRALYMTRRIR